MSKFSKIILTLILLGLFLPYVPAQAAGNAIFRLTSARTDYYVGENVYVDVMVEPNGESINVVRLISNFTGGDVLLINDFNLGTAWPNQSPGRELNNTTQHINVGGFILVDSVTTNSKFGTLIFKANKIGSSAINFVTGSHLISPDQIERLNLAGSQNITINVIGTPPPPPPPPPANHAPVFSPVANKQINLGEKIEFSVSASDQDGDLINLTWNLPSGATFTNVTNNAKDVGGNFSWTPTQAGVYTLTFTATDNINPAVPLTISIGVNVPPPPVNHAPVFEPISEKTINAGDTLIFNISATDPDGDNVSLSLEPLETAILTPITTGITSSSRFSWIPKSSGIYYVVFKAQDNHSSNPLSSNQSARITVFGGQCPPCSGGGGGATCPIPQCAKQDFGKPLVRDLPVITSPSHPNTQLWYSNNKPQFIWEASDPGLGYVFNIDQNPLSDPTFGYFFSQDKAFAFSAVPDGFWYFHLKVKYADGYGPTAHYQVKIDTTAPEFFKPSIETEILRDNSKQYKIYFTALDKFSGVNYYEMKIDQGDWQKVQSPYVLSPADLKGKIMTMRAVDNSGNAIEAQIDLQKLILIKTEAKPYVIGQPSFKVEPPLIDKIALPLFIGRATPGAKIKLFISSNLQTILYTLADDQGNWVASLTKPLPVGKYSIYGIANVNNNNSQPSEKVYFYVKQPIKMVPSYFWQILLVIMGILLLLLLRYLKNLIKKRELYKRGLNNGEIQEQINDLQKKNEKIKEIKQSQAEHKDRH